MKKLFLILIVTLFTQNTFAQIPSNDRMELSFYTRDNGIKEDYLVFFVNVQDYHSWSGSTVNRAFLKIHHRATTLADGRELLLKGMAQEIPIFYQCQDCFPEITGIELKSDKLLVSTNQQGPDGLIIFQWVDNEFRQMKIMDKLIEPTICFPHMEN